MRNHKDPLLRSSIVCPDFDASYPVIDHGVGAYLYDKQGKQYVDCAGGKAAVANIGHGRKEIGEIMSRQARKIAISPTHYFRSDELDHYLESLVSYAPPGFCKAWTVNSGTEAVENAMKLAIQYHQLNRENKKYKVIGRWGSYHGNSVYALDVGGMELRRNNLLGLMHNSYHAPSAFCYRCSLGLESRTCRLACASAIEEQILKEGPETIAALICEPVVGAALGAVPAPENYFAEARAICDKYGVLMIADEVMTGFARTGYNFAIEHWNVQPDIIALGKGMASGYYPLSGILINEKVADIFENKKQPFFGGHTYSCNPLGAAVGQYVLDCMIKEKLAEHSREAGEYFVKKLKDLSRHHIVGDVRGMGLLIGVELVQDQMTKRPFDKSMKVSRMISHQAMEHGVIFYPGSGSAGRGEGDHILITPPLVINKEQIDKAVSVLDFCLQHFIEHEMEKAG
ncbi:MAG: aspartate aminotransferase family protein [Bacteroidota bacterium]